MYRLCSAGFEGSKDGLTSDENVTTAGSYYETKAEYPGNVIQAFVPPAVHRLIAQGVGN